MLHIDSADRLEFYQRYLDQASPGVAADERERRLSQMLRFSVWSGADAVAHSPRDLWEVAAVRDALRTAVAGADGQHPEVPLAAFGVMNDEKPHQLRVGVGRGGLSALGSRASASLVDWARPVSYNEQVKHNLSDELRAEIMPAATCTPGQRLLQCIELAEAGLAMKKAQLARLFPDDTEAEKAKRFQEWLLHREDAPWGDGEGRPVQRAF